MLDLWGGGLAFIPSLLYVYVYSIQLKLNTKQPQKKESWIAAFTALSFRPITAGRKKRQEKKKKGKNRIKKMLMIIII